MVLPILTYRPLVTFTNSNVDTKIAKLEKRAGKIIGTTQVIPSVTDIKRKRICTFVHKCINDDVCVNFKNYFTVLSNKTRNNGTLIYVS